MKNSETGEFELVLGNKQLLSGFFIVVILFGVFFTMGYIVGRNSAPPIRLANGAESNAAAAPATVAAPAASQQGPAAETAPVSDEPSTAPPAEPEVPAPHPGTAPAQAETAAAPGSAPPAKSIIRPAPGETYLQVMAVKRPEAEVVAKTLRDKGFRIVLGPGPNDLIRVLVGPYGDTASLGAAKASLENAGFHPIVRK